MDDLIMRIAAAMAEPIDGRTKRDKMQRYIVEWYNAQPHAGIPDGPPRQATGKAKQAAAWLQDRPFATIKEAARIFGVSHGAVAAARQDGPYPAYRGPHQARPDPLPENIMILLEAVRWVSEDPNRTMPEAAARFGVRLDATRRAMYYAPGAAAGR